MSWRVDKQMGFGPSRQITGAWRLDKGASSKEKYRLYIYTGDFDGQRVEQAWKAYARQ